MASLMVGSDVRRLCCLGACFRYSSDESLFDTYPQKIVISVSTKWYFKTVTAQYPWERFCIVRTVLADEGDFRINRVELVAKEMHAVLTVAKFPAIAIAKAEENRWNKVTSMKTP
ncbi:MAG: hypothetical protein HC765_01810 [Brachymonas sp.]|nr:hypothetical protein [Brachymonas sp.]